jgi:hypothetical protein
VAICNRLVRDWEILFVTPDRRREAQTKKQTEAYIHTYMHGMTDQGTCGI